MGVSVLRLLYVLAALQECLVQHQSLHGTKSKGAQARPLQCSRGLCEPQGQCKDASVFPTFLQYETW